MVKLFAHKKSIYAWDFGNECNYAINAKSRDAAENWTMTMSNAVKAADSQRPLVSGMCGLGVTSKNWRIEDQANNADILTTHPYPYWVSHCKNGKITSIQTLMHATCETKLYANIGEKPCLVEEIGTMGPMVCDDETAGNFMKLNLYSNWVNGASGVMWWCANEQLHLPFPPYEFQMCEVELGMFDKHGKAKPVLNEVKKFSEWLSKVDYTLPKPTDDAVCLITEEQEQWGVSYSGFVLAKEAGVNISFADATKKIPDSEIYLMPSIHGCKIMPSYLYAELKDKVRDGAVLYISNEDGILSEFNDLTGLIVRDSEIKTNSGHFDLNGKTLDYRRDRTYIIEANGAEILAVDETGMPLFTKHRYGKGTVYYLNFPLEKNLIDVSDGFDGCQHEIYNEIFRARKSCYPITYENPYIGVTRHIDGNAEWMTMINYSPVPQKVNAQVKENIRYEVVKGSLEQIDPFELTIVKIG